jgi:hypothetical protein
MGRTITTSANRLGKIANFVVNTRLYFARNFIFNRKYKVPKLATFPSAGTLGDIFKGTE